jgi:hypothetical protein
VGWFFFIFKEEKNRQGNVKALLTGGGREYDLVVAIQERIRYMQIPNIGDTDTSIELPVPV